MMEPAGLLAQLRQEPDLTTREARLRAWLPHQPEMALAELLELLRQEVFAQKVISTDEALGWLRLLRYTTGWSGRPQHLALGLRLEAFFSTVAREDYGQALAYFDAAIRLLNDNRFPVDRARIEVTRVWALACVGRLDDALAAGQTAADVLTAHEVWPSLGTLYMNLSLALNRAGDQGQALAYIEKAEAVYERLGSDGWQNRLNAVLNRGMILSDLGQYQEATAVFETVLAQAAKRGAVVFSALAQANLGRIYEYLGQYGRALKLYDEAVGVLQAQERQRNALLIQLNAVQCLLALARYTDAIARCQRLRPELDALGLELELAGLLLSEGQAQAGLRQYEAAQTSYQAAQRLYVRQAADYWVNHIDLELARLLQMQGNFAASTALAAPVAERLHAAGSPSAAALVELLMAENAWQLGDRAQVTALLSGVLAFAQAQGVSELELAGQRLLGLVSASQNDMAAAVQHYERAIASLEKLQRQIMIEHRADYLAGKHDIFELMVAGQLALDQPEQAFQYVERAKSQALVDMVALRLDVGVRARDPADAALVTTLNELQSRRDQFVRQWQQRQAAGDVPPDAELRIERAQLAELEDEITQTWHRLLIRNERYAQDAALWQAHYEPVQPYLDEQTALIDYFAIEGALIAFLLIDDTVTAVPLGVSVQTVEKWLGRLHFYMRSAARARPAQLPVLTRNTQQLLQQCQQALLAPLAGRLTGRHLIIVPHGALHYLPFAALFDGERYLLQDHAISYLPGATFLRYCREAERAADGALVLGHSFNGALACTQSEAAAIAAIWETQPLLEDAATVTALTERAAGQRLLHLAAHGDFRADNPLFSGLALADGWLTTLSVFDLQLQASLVTLSACQTGLSVVGGGQELLGLMRAFLSAGAASLISSLWTVDDQSTAQLMTDLYAGLAAGQGKAAALRQAQLNLLNQEQNGVQPYAHPFFWAPFYLIGDENAL